MGTFNYCLKSIGSGMYNKKSGYNDWQYNREKPEVGRLSQQFGAQFAGKSGIADLGIIISTLNMGMRYMGSKDMEGMV